MGVARPGCVATVVMQTASRVSYARGRLWALAGGSVGSGVFATVPSVILLYYLTETLLVAPPLAGAIIVTPKLLGIAIDPLIGAASDTIRTRFGRRRPFVLAGAAVMCPAFVALFNPPTMPAPMIPLYAFLCYLAVSIGYSLFAVPYITMFGEIAGDESFRTRWIGQRMIFLFVGTLLGAACPPILVEQFGGGAAGYGRMALLVGAVSGLTMVAAALSMSRLEQSPPAAKTTPRLSELLEPLRSVTYRRTLVTYLLLMMASSATTSALPYFVVEVLRRPISEVGTFLGIALTCAAVTASLWSLIIEQCGAGRALARSMLFAGFAAVALVLSPDHISLLYAGAVLSGIATAGTQVAAFVLLAEESAGRPSPAIYTGVWTSTEKLGLALGPAGVAFILALAPRASVDINTVTGAQPYLLVAIGLLPMLMLVIAALVSRVSWSK